MQKIDKPALSADGSFSPLEPSLLILSACISSTTRSPTCMHPENVYSYDNTIFADANNNSEFILNISSSLKHVVF